MVLGRVEVDLKAQKTTWHAKACLLGQWNKHQINATWQQWNTALVQDKKVPLNVQDDTQYLKHLPLSSHSCSHSDRSPSLCAGVGCGLCRAQPTVSRLPGAGLAVDWIVDWKVGSLRMVSLLILGSCLIKSLKLWAFMVYLSNGYITWPHLQVIVESDSFL